MLHSVFFALMVGSATHPPHLTRIPFAPHTPPASALPPPTPPPDHGSPPAPVSQYSQLCRCRCRCRSSTVYWKQPAWLHMPCPRVGAWT